MILIAVVIILITVIFVKSQNALLKVQIDINLKLSLIFTRVLKLTWKIDRSTLVIQLVYRKFQLLWCKRKLSDSTCKSLKEVPFLFHLQPLYFPAESASFLYHQIWNTLHLTPKQTSAGVKQMPSVTSCVFNVPIKRKGIVMLCPSYPGSSENRNDLLFQAPTM